MADMRLIIDETGIREYNDEFDVVIHCENEQQMDKAMALLRLANRMHWSKTAENPPTEEDADEFGIILVLFYSEEKKMWRVASESCHLVSVIPEEFPFWMPLPEPPKEIPHE